LRSIEKQWGVPGSPKGVENVELEKVEKVELEKVGK